MPCEHESIIDVNGKKYRYTVSRFRDELDEGVYRTLYCHDLEDESGNRFSINEDSSFPLSDERVKQIIESGEIRSYCSDTTPSP